MTTSGRMHGHAATRPAGAPDRRWLTAALAVIVIFLVGEFVAGLLAHSLALLTDSAHMLSDAAALGVAILASRIAEKPARGAYTFGFARVDALSGQLSGLTLLLLAIWFVVEAVLRLVHPPNVQGGVVVAVAIIGLVANALAAMLARRADQRSLNVRGVLAHLVTDAWAFAATLTAGLVVVLAGQPRADPVASLVVAGLMTVSGVRLVHAAGRVFLEAAPSDVDPDRLGAELASLEGVAELHDLHVWQIGPAQTALSAHLLVRPSHDCHEVSERLRARLRSRHDIGHVTLQTEHVTALASAAEACADTHGAAHTGRTGDAEHG